MIVIAALCFAMAVGCAWTDGCNHRFGLFDFLRRTGVYIVAALGAACMVAVRVVLGLHGVPGRWYLPLAGLGWGLLAQLSLLGRRLSGASGGSGSGRPRWVTPIPGLEGHLLKVLERYQQRDGSWERQRLDRLLDRLSRRLYRKLKGQAFAALLDDYLGHLQVHYTTGSDEYDKYKVDARGWSDQTSRVAVLRLLREIAAKSDGDYVETLRRRARYLCRHKN
ncbi:MAG: hypothetical protein ACJ74O_06080 [Frankiaceae bacterium]